MSLSQPAVANKLRLLRFSEVEREFILKNGLTERHARCLLRILDPEQRVGLLKNVVLSGLNVNQTEKIVDRVLDGKFLDGFKDGGEANKEKNTDYCVDLVQKTVKKMRNDGFEAKSVCTETDGFYICTITIKKNNA